LPADLTDAQWWADAERRYEEYWREFTGSPDSLATGGRWFYMSGEFGAAALMYQKAIDLLHMLYCCNDLPLLREVVGVRQPSAADLPITDGYRNSLGAAVSLHPDAPRRRLGQRGCRPAQRHLLFLQEIRGFGWPVCQCAAGAGTGGPKVRGSHQPVRLRGS
jgi:hypothetical protein